MFQGLALSDDLDRVLEKHDLIATGVPLRVEQPRTEPAQKLVPVDSLLIDMGDGSNLADKRQAVESVRPNFGCFISAILI